MSAKRASLGGHRQGLCLQMHRISNDPTCSDLPALCSELDHGGGVFINSTFMVYTLTSYPPFLTHAMSDPPHPLKVAASRIASHIPFVFHLSSTDKITSLPIPGNVELEIHRIPYFFANAATCTRGLCVAGRNHSVVETLLAVLGRPWCVIEFCCGGSDEAVSALSEFAQAARDICPSSAYTAAVLLFQHELATRQANRGGGMYETRNNTARSAKWLEVCKTVFDISSNSYNGFWLRLVCCVAVGMGLQYSVVGQMLDGVDLRDRWRSLRLAPPLATRSILGVSERRLSRSRSLVHFHNDVRKKVLCPSLSTDRVETNAVFFMRVYSYLLRVLLETNV